MPGRAGCGCGIVSVWTGGSAAGRTDDEKEGDAGKCLTGREMRGGGIPCGGGVHPGLVDMDGGEWRE